MRVPARAQQKIDGDPEEQDTHSDGGIARKLKNSVEDDQPGGGDEKAGGPGMAGDAIAGRVRSRLRGSVAGLHDAIAATEDEEAACGKAEEEPVHDDDVAEDLLVGAEKGDGCGEGALKGDGPHGDARARADLGENARKDFVFRHGEINARVSEHSVAEETQSGQSDGNGDDGGAGSTEGAAHDFGGGRLGEGEADGAECAHINEIDRDVEQNDAEHAEEEGAGHVAAGVADFGGDEIGGLPASVSEHDGNHGRAEDGEQIEGQGAIEHGMPRERRRGDGAEDHPNSGSDNHGDRQDAENHEEALDAAASANAEAIDDREGSNNYRGNEIFGDRDAREFVEIFREGDGRGGCAAGSDDE